MVVNLSGNYERQIIHLEKQVAQARADALREVGETICVLVGNLMLEDMDAGKKLANQLRPILDYCKAGQMPRPDRGG